MFWKKHWHRCFWRCLKKKKHCINDASNGVNRPPLTGTRLSRLIETWKFTTICLVIYNVYYTSILLFIGSSSAGRSRKFASENLGAFTASGEGPEHRLTIKDCRLWNIFLTSGCLRVSFIASFASLLFSRFGGNLFGKVKVKRQKIMFPIHEYQDWLNRGSLEDLVHRCSTIQTQLVRCQEKSMHTLHSAQCLHVKLGMFLGSNFHGGCLECFNNPIQRNDPSWEFQEIG